MSTLLVEKLAKSEAGLVALTNLLAAYVQAGKDTQVLEAAIATAIGKPAQKTTIENDHKTTQNQVNGVKTGTGIFKVLECRESKPGVIRAYAEAENGGKHAIFAKNSNGQVLAQAVGKIMEIRYKQGDKGLIALNVRLV